MLWSNHRYTQDSLGMLGRQTRTMKKICKVSDIDHKHGLTHGRDQVVLHRRQVQVGFEAEDTGIGEGRSVQVRKEVATMSARAGMYEWYGQQERAG